MKTDLPRLLLAGTHSGCGKTTVTCAILQALVDRGTAVVSFKCGPDYIDPMFHSEVIGAQCRNLDLHFFDENTLRALLTKDAQSRTLSLIEGVMGYYDGVGLTDQASTYAIAKAAEAPAVLVVNARGAARSLLATLHGFLTLRPDSGIRGVLFNNCPPTLYPRLAAAVEEAFAGTVKPYGYLPSLPTCAIESRHLGLITAGELTDLRDKLHTLAQQAEQSIDLAGLLNLAQSAPPLTWAPLALPPAGEPVRIGVARDRAFCFYYEDNLDLLRQLGAELVPFSPLSDATLPDHLDGLYLGGGYPELYPRQLSKNQTMRASIRAALQRGLPCIAECGGFLYLQQSLAGEPMVGHLSGAAFDTGKLSRFGYVTLTAHSDNLLCQAGERLQAHEFHYWDVDHPGDAFTAAKGGKTWLCAVAGETLYAGFPHFHFYTDPWMAHRFLTACRKEHRRHA